MPLLRHAFHWLRRLADPPLFVLTCTPTGLRCTRGRLPGRQLADAAAVARHFDLVAGEIEGVRRGGALVLRFSPSIPPAAHQRLRNVLGNLP